MKREGTQGRDWLGWMQAIASFFVPIVLAFLGIWISEQQRSRDFEQRNLDRVEFLTKSISSENEKERQIAVGVVEYLKDEGLLPDELRAALLESTLRDEEVVGGEELPTATPDAGTLAVEDAGPLVSPGTPPPVEPNDNSSERLARMFPRVHFFVPDPRQKKAAWELKAGLQKRGFSLRQIWVKPTYSGARELRYFHDYDADNAAELAAALAGLGLPIKTVGATRYGHRVQPRLYEVWLDPYALLSGAK